MHEPECGGVEREPHLIGGRAVTRHAIRRQLRLVQLDQVFHLSALAVDVLTVSPARLCRVVYAGFLAVRWISLHGTANLTEGKCPKAISI
jgi:hypothetical protein